MGWGIESLPKPFSSINSAHAHVGLQSGAEKEAFSRGLLCPQLNPPALHSSSSLADFQPLLHSWEITSEPSTIEHLGQIIWPTLDLLN